MITLMRKHAQSWLIKLLLIIVAVTFVISFGVGQFTSSRLVLVKVGSVEISVKQFNGEYERELNSLRERVGDNADAVAQQLNLRRQVFDRMINRQLILNAAEAQGLVVTDQEVNDFIAVQPFFLVENSFDVGAYRQVLANNRMTPEMYEERTRRDLQVQKYQRHLLAGLVVAKGEIEQRYRIENEKVEVETFRMQPEKFRGAVISDSQAEKTYYDAHEREFTQPDQFKVRTFVLSLDKVQPGVKVRERAIKRYYERYWEERFTTPKRVRASHILKKLTRDAGPEESNRVRKELEAVLERLRAGENFAKLAKRHSEDFSKTKGGDLGLFAREDMLPEFADAAFALNVGQLSGIVRTNFGLHIIKVTKVQPAVVKSYEQVKPEVRKLLHAQRAERKLGLEAGRLPQRIASEGIEAVAGEWGQNVLTSRWFDRTGELKQAGRAQALYAQVKSRKPGEAGVLRRNPVQGHVFYQVLEKKDAFLKPLEKVRKAVAARVIEGRSADAALQAAKDAFEDINAAEASKALAKFKALARKHGLPMTTVEFTAVDTNIPRIGANPKFQEVAFRLTPDKPFGLSINGKTAHLLRLKKRRMPDAGKAEETRKRITVEIQADWAQYFLDSELERLKAEIEIEVMTPELISSL